MVDALNPPSRSPASAPASRQAPAPPARAQGDVAKRGPGDELTLFEGRPSWLKGSEPTLRIGESGPITKAEAQTGANLARLPARKQAEALGVAREHAVVMATFFGDPESEIALARFLGSPQHSDDAKVRTMQALAQMASQEFAPGINGVQLLRGVVQEIADPGTINQRANDTCTATTVQILLAMKAPAAYVDVVASLADNAGGVAQLIGGGTMARVPGSQDTAAAERRGDHRTPSSRLFQSAAMELGNGVQKDYDLVQDTNVDATSHEVLNPGLQGAEHADLEAQVLGVKVRDYSATSMAPTDLFIQKMQGLATDAELEAAGRVPLKAGLDAALRDGPVAAGFDWSDRPGQDPYAGHKVVVLRKDDAGYLIRNPQGFTERMSEPEVARRLYNATLPVEAMAKPRDLSSKH